MPKQGQQIEIDTNHLEPLFSRYQVVRRNWPNFLWTALIRNVPSWIECRRDPAGAEEPDVVTHPGMNDDCRSETYTLSLNRRRTSQPTNRVVLTEAAIPLVFNEMATVETEPIAELAGGSDDALRWENKSKSRLKPTSLKLFFISGIRQKPATQTHGEYSLVVQWFRMAWRPVFEEK